MTGKNWMSKESTASYKDLTLVTAGDILKYVSTLKPLIQSILGEGEATIIVGPGGVGKSFITLFIALFVATANKTANFSMNSKSKNHTQH